MKLELEHAFRLLAVEKDSLCFSRDYCCIQHLNRLKRVVAEQVAIMILRWLV